MVGAPVTEVPVRGLALSRLHDVMTPAEARALAAALGHAAEELGGAQVWCVNSTATGGGVAQMLHATLGYAAGAGIDAHWAVVGGTPAFFGVTKRLHHALHGRPPGIPFSAEDREVYEDVMYANALGLSRAVRPGDLVVLHDPQTAGLARPLQAAGAHVVLRLHVGADRPNEHTREAWAFLRPSVVRAGAFVFSQRAFVWPGLPADRVALITPAIDPADVKNRALGRRASQSILDVIGIGPPAQGEPVFRHEDGTPGRVVLAAEVLQERRLQEDEPYVLHTARWDPLKNPLGVLRMFAENVAPTTGAALVLAGPAPSGIADDPEGEGVLEAVRTAWAALDPKVRERVHVLNLPLAPPEENAAVVNALQRRAAVIAKMSLAEGFGLGVTEALWKARPVVAPAVGGLREQVIHGLTGLAVPDPMDDRAFAEAIVLALSDRALARRLGEAGHRRVRDRFLEPLHLRRWMEVLRQAAAPPRRTWSRGGAVANS